MRFTGSLLIIAGLLLCVSVVWAAIGFLLMGWGLICLLVAERRRKQSTASPATPSADMADRREPVLIPQQTIAGEPVSPAFATDELVVPAEQDLSAEAAHQGQPSAVRAKRGLGERKERGPRRTRLLDSTPSDAEKWRALVAGDADLARSVEVLAPFGQQYVDQLATAYLAFQDKAHLPGIVKMVIATIKKNAGRDTASGTMIDDHQEADLISFALSKTRSASLEQAAASLIAVEPDTASGARAIPDAGRKSAAVQPSREVLAPAEAGKGRASGRFQPGPGDPVEAAAPGPRVVAVDPDDAKDLADLLKRIA